MSNTLPTIGIRRKHDTQTCLFCFNNFIYSSYFTTYVLIMTLFWDETIRSSHDTIRIDTKAADMIIYDTIRYGSFKNTIIHYIHILLFIITN